MSSTQESIDLVNMYESKRSASALLKSTQLEQEPLRSRCDAQYHSIPCSSIRGIIEDTRQTLALNSTGSIPPIQRQSSYEYTHQVDTCSCGICHKARVDSGIQGLYEKKSAIDRVSTTRAGATARDYPSFTNSLFIAMGIQHDSKCPHGMPFYACMCCS